LPSAIVDTLRKVVAFLEGGGFGYMVVGGYALPFYGAVRTTLDIDIAVAVRTEDEFAAFSAAAQAAGFVLSVGSFHDGVSVFRVGEKELEVEFWTRPDGVAWDAETLSRRTRQEIGGLPVWVISPEDFVVNKLARRDRGVQDEKDAMSVLERLSGSLDRKYLLRRVQSAGVGSLFEALEASL
jgi:predicted nucleotidyltransferase